MMRLSCNQRSVRQASGCSAHVRLAALTKIRSSQRFIREVNPEPAPMLPTRILAELRDGQTSAIDRDRVPDGAVVQDGSGIADGECEARVRIGRGDGRDGRDVLNLQPA